MLVEKLLPRKGGLELINDQLKEIHEKNGTEFRPWNSIDEFFIPFHLWSESLCDEDKKEFNMVIEDINFDENCGVFVSKNNITRNLLEVLTTCRFKSKRVYAHGTCDNVSQIFRKYSKIIDDPYKKYIVTVEPIFKNDQPDDSSGFKWERTGNYIGIFTQTAKELKNEKEIGFIFRYLIFEV